ncbi:short-chain dehydrogenase [Anaerobacillus alkalilacustris]|uniref:Short-chain dehydrogenase n=1 Tax=Anaerobacillus alkalilacustris TaxID=393763 RepID=A0A1S2LWA2_9BACI|nr:SDR family NAD(P)-dependent oxidoreductase [Anaerobacillus alkalilacustris]OIJ16808.1 short-chain dehydrogenase [Anaerobacillus alkalilacustris]
MSERIVIITGANSGIGKAATEKFARAGYHVVMACRNLEISKQVQEEIKEVTGSSRVDLMQIDVSSFNSIRTFCSEFKNKYQKLDVLVNNAAYFNHGEKKFQLSNDNLELTFATNLFGPFLLTQLLVDELAKSEDPRILNACTTNIRHFFDPKREIELDNLYGEKDEPYNVYKRYGDSKMALLMTTIKMADEYKNKNIKVNAIQIPAIKISKRTIQKIDSVWWRTAARIQNLFTPNPSTMAETYFSICTSKQWSDVTGKLINDKVEVVQPSQYGANGRDSIKQFFDKGVYPKYADNKEMIEYIWELCTELTKCSKEEEIVFC